MAVNNPRVYEAFEEEAKGIDVQDLMAQMMQSYSESKEYAPTVSDEIQIRKMLLARKYLTHEQERLVRLKEAIVAEWNERIKAKSNEIQSINDFIESFVKNQNNGKKISLDVGTVTLRRAAPKVKLNTEMKDEAAAFLKQHNLYESFTKAPELDATLLQNSYIDQFNTLVAKETEKRIEAEKEQNGKITKKREGIIKLEVERELADEYFARLPKFMKYIPENYSLSITMK